MIVTFVILGVTILLFISNKLRPDVVAILSLLALFLTGILTVSQSLAGFADSTVIMVAALFVVGEGLGQTGITAWLGQRLTNWAGDSQTRLLMALMVGTAALSAFLSNTGTIAMLLPAALAAVWRLKSLPSRFLIPMAFAASLGGLMTLIGTPPNIVISDTLTAANMAPFGFFEYAKIGIPLFLAALAYMLWLGRRLLPAHQAVNPPTDVTEWMGSVVEAYGLDTRLFRLRIRKASSLAGKTLAEVGLGSQYHLSVLAIEHGDTATEGTALSDQERRKLVALLKRHQDDSTLPGAQTVVQADDVLVVKGAREQVERAMLDLNLGVQEVSADPGAMANVLLSPEIGVAEVLLAPRAECLGSTVAEAQIAEKYNVQVLSILRGNRTESRQATRLQFGDSLLVRGTWADIGLLRNETQNFVVAGAPEAMVTQIAALWPSYPDCRRCPHSDGSAHGNQCDAYRDRRVDRRPDHGIERVRSAGQCLPGHQLANGGPHCGDITAEHGATGDRRCAAHRRYVGEDRGHLGTNSLDGDRLSAHRRVQPGHQQYGNHSPHRPYRPADGGDPRRVPLSVVDHGGSRCIVGLPHADCIAGQHLGNDTWQLQFQRLLQGWLAPLDHRLDHQPCACTDHLAAVAANCKPCAMAVSKSPMKVHQLLSGRPR